MRALEMRMFLTWLVGVTVMLCAEGANGETLAEQDAQSDKVIAFAKEFRRAVLANDELYLRRLTVEAGGFDEHTRRFIYDDAEVQRFAGSKGRSVAAILSVPKLGFIYEGAIEHGPQSGTSYIIYFYEISDTDEPAPYERVPWLVNNMTWMEVYVACRVMHRDGRWLMQGSFCYNETEGPW